MTARSRKRKTTPPDPLLLACLWVLVASPTLLTTCEVAGLVGRSEENIRRRCRHGELGRFSPRLRVYLVELSELIAYVRSRPRSGYDRTWCVGRPVPIIGAPQLSVEYRRWPSQAPRSASGAVSQFPEHQEAADRKALSREATHLSCKWQRLE
jgi:hypothetical protein